MSEPNTPSFAPDAPSLESLLAQVALGDRAAFEILYRNTSDKLFGICVRVLNERAEAEEALQEVFTSVWRKAAQFDAGARGCHELARHDGTQQVDRPLARAR